MDIEPSFIEQITTEKSHGLRGIEVEVHNKIESLRFVCNPMARIYTYRLTMSKLAFTIVSTPETATTSSPPRNESVFQEELALAFAQYNASPSDFQIRVIASQGIDQLQQFQNGITTCNGQQREIIEIHNSQTITTSI